MSIASLYSVRQISGGEGRTFIRENHYSRSCHNGPMCWGLFDGDRLIGVCAFATPNSENVVRAPFGVGHEREVTELHRLVVLDGTPTNTETWFIARALEGLREYRPQYRAVLSFADGSEGHRGVIYQASNAIYTGMTGRARFWRDGDGRLRHPRQNGHNVTPEEAEEKGWMAEMREAKHRYVFLVGGPAERRRARRELILPSLPYPTVHLGLDPGLSTGFAIADFSATKQLTLLDDGAIPNGLLGFVEWFPRLLAEYQVDRVVCEKFIIDGTITGTWSAQIEGALVALYDGPITWQKRDDKAALLPDEAERRRWFKRAGVRFKSTHALDAATHLLVERKRARHDPTLRWWWPPRS